MAVPSSALREVIARVNALERGYARGCRRLLTESGFSSTEILIAAVDRARAQATQLRIAWEHVGEDERRVVEAFATLARLMDRVIDEARRPQVRL